MCFLRLWSEHSVLLAQQPAIFFAFSQYNLARNVFTANCVHAFKYWESFIGSRSTCEAEEQIVSN